MGISHFKLNFFLSGTCMIYECHVQSVIINYMSGLIEGADQLGYCVYYITFFVSNALIFAVTIEYDMSYNNIKLNSLVVQQYTITLAYLIRTNQK